MSKTRGRARTKLAAAIVACLSIVAGCDDPDEVVTGTVSDALGSGLVRWINGSYAGCAGRTGAWSARVSGTDAMDNPALAVVKNDTGCQLTVTGLYADQGYAATTPILLGTSYAAVPSSFGTGGTQFLGNAKLDAVSFGADFQITLVYGDGGNAPASTASSSVTSSYASNQSSVATTLVPPSSYTLDLSNLRFQTDILQLVVGLTGQAVLNDGAVTGSSYVIESGSLAETPTYAQTASAYDLSFLTQKTITGANPIIQASDFGILGLSLFGTYQVRNVIVKRAVGGIAAYQIFRVTFTS